MLMNEISGNLISFIYATILHIYNKDKRDVYTVTRIIEVIRRNRSNSRK